MKAVTIDNLGITVHERWAQDQKALDIGYAQEAKEVASHPQILGLSLIYPSKFDELFGLQERTQHWANFSAPKNFHAFSKQYYSYRLFPNMGWEEEEEEEEKEREKEHPLIRAILSAKKHHHQSHSHFEKDRSTLVTMVESIEWINELLKQIHGRKLQYQKG